MNAEQAIEWTSSVLYWLNYARQNLRTDAYNEEIDELSARAGEVDELIRSQQAEIEALKKALLEGRDIICAEGNYDRPHAALAKLQTWINRYVGRERKV